MQSKNMLLMKILFALFLTWTIVAESHEVSLCVNICPTCLPHECPTLPGCEIKVKLPGCGCCLACASLLGERCGITRPCANGLKCLEKRGVLDIMASLENRGTCQNQKANNGRAANSNIINYRRRARRERKRKRVPRHPHHGLFYPINFEGPCSRHYEQLMTSCETLPERVWVPTCEQGYYAPKQCMSSNGGSRGRCWCVNENGGPIQNTPFTNRNLTCVR